MTKEELNYEMFIKELEQISKKYGIALSGCGIIKYTDEKGFREIKYTNDLSGGDLWIENIKFSDDSQINL